MIIRPKPGAILAISVATSFIWGLGLVGLSENPLDINAWLALGLAAVVVGYIASEKIEILHGRIRAYRYFLLRAEADASSVKLVKARVGQPPILPGLAIRTETDDTVAQILPWNYSSQDLAILRAELERHD